MRPSSSILGASRLPLTPKRANKDYYKGTKQAYVPGGGHRTGPPGKHVVNGTAKYRLVDEQVRFFVGPGKGVLAATDLKPYVSTQISPSRPPPEARLPSFSPNARPYHAASSSSASPSTAVAEPETDPSASTAQLLPRDFTRFSRRYQRATFAEKQALIQASRRDWWNAVQGRFGVDNEVQKERGAQEGVTERVEANLEQRPRA